MARFDDCLKVVLQFEGGYSDRAADRGGATNKGVTQATYTEWRVDQGLQPQAVRAISDTEVATIYRDGYWTAASRFSAPLDLVVFDAAIQHGTGRAIKCVQRVIGVDADGLWGPRSDGALRAALQQRTPRQLAQAVIDERRRFYNAIVAADPDQAANLNGWMNRMKSLERAIGG